METQRIEEPFDFSKITRVVIPKSIHEIEYEERVRERLAQNYTREQIYENITRLPDLAHLGSLIGTSYENSKKLNKLIRQANSLKKHLETHMDHNNQDSKSLLGTLKKIIRLVTSYQRDTSDLPYDWVRGRFLPFKFRGWKYSYPEVEPWVLLIGAKKEMKYVPLDDDDCETVNGSKTVEEPLKDPLSSRLRISFPRHLSTQNQDPNSALYVLFHLCEKKENFSDAKEINIWLEFKEFDKRDPKFYGEIKSIGVDHPIVSVVGDFAVDAFNKACKKNVKKGEDNNLHGFEFMECKYMKLGKFHHFYMIIEGIEEGNPGTYMAEVTCNSINGAKILCKFFLTDDRPFGMKAMAVSYFYYLESICNTVDDLCKEKQARLKELYKHTNVRERPTAALELCHLKTLHAKLWEVYHPFRKEIKGFVYTTVLLVRCDSARLRCPPDFDRMTNPDGWCDPVDYHGSGMVRRASCSGYDYYNPHI